MSEAKKEHLVLVYIVLMAMLAFGCMLLIGLLRLAWQLIRHSPHQAPWIEDGTSVSITAGISSADENQVTHTRMWPSP
jgi:hypothetical protein